MSTRSRTRKLFALHQLKASRASRQRSRKQTHDARLQLERMEDRVMLSAIVSVPSGATGVAQPNAWMGALSGSIPLTDVSLPGTYKSASGPSLQDAALGRGSQQLLPNIDVNADLEASGITPPSDTNLYYELEAAALITHKAAQAATLNALRLQGASTSANAAATGLNGLAISAQVAAGISETSSGALLAKSLAAASTSLISAINRNNHANLLTTNAAAIAAVDGATADVSANDGAAATANTAAATTNKAAGVADGTAGAANAIEGAELGAAGVAEQLAGDSNATQAGDDVVDEIVDIAAEAEGGVDPVADGLAAAANLVGAADSTEAALADGAADAAAALAALEAIFADGEDEATTVPNEAVVIPNQTASGADATAAAMAPADAAVFTTAATAHQKQAVADALTAAGYTAQATADLVYAEQLSSFVATSGLPSTNSVYQAAVAAASAASAAAAPALASAAFDAAAAIANLNAAAADTAAADAIAAATAANEEAEIANDNATAADEEATANNQIAATDNASAVTADAAATVDNSAALPLNAAASVADGTVAATNTAAAVADTTAIALEATALATVEIPFVDIGTAAAALTAEGVAIGLDGASDVADTAGEIADGLAATADVVSEPVDSEAAAQDEAAQISDQNAARSDAIAATDDALANTADMEAASADEAAITACNAALAANEAAATLDTNATRANLNAAGYSLAMNVADLALWTIVSNNPTVPQGTSDPSEPAQTPSVQTQTASITDQLNAGIRSLDLRGALVNDTINLNAGAGFTGVTLQDALNDMTSFLQANPSETIVVALSSNEARATNSVNSFNADLNTLLNSSDTAVPGTTYSHFIYASSDPSATPDLGQVRGKIVIIPSGWKLTADSGTRLTSGWAPTEVIQDTHTDADPNTRWNHAQDDNGAGLIPTDLGNPDTLYVNNLSQDSTATEAAVTLGDSVNAIAEQYFGSVQVTRTAGIVGMDDPDPKLIDEIINENHLPITVTSDSDAAADTGTLRDAITQANSQPGVNTIEFANDLTGTAGNVITLQSSLPVVANDLVVAGTVLINANGHTGLTAASTHQVTEYNYVAPLGTPPAPTTTADTPPVYLDTSGLTNVAPGTVAVKPVNITYGTALVDSQLHGIATDKSGTSIPGTFKYASAPDGVLGAGDGQTEAVTFTPTDTKVSATSTTVTVNVASATPALSNVSPNPVNLTYGTPLDGTQLSGTATFTVGGKSTNVPGTFAYTSAGGRVLTAGNGHSESVTFLPNDTTDYTSASSTVTVNVARATPTVTVNPVDMSFGTQLDNTQLSGTATDSQGASIPGTFAFNTSVAGTTLACGSGQIEDVTFTPDDTTDYKTVSTSVTINVNSQGRPSVIVNPVNITYGTALDNGQLSGTAVFFLSQKVVIVPGTFTYNSLPDGVLGAGDGQSEAVTFTPTDTTTYTTVPLTATVNVAQATPTVESVNPVNFTYGTALDNGQLTGTVTWTVNGSPVTLQGTFAYTTATGVLGAGNGKSETVTFTPDDTTNYTPASSTVTVNVAQATPTVTVNPVTIIYGTALANSQLSGTVTWTVDRNLVTVPGTFFYSSTFAPLLNAGNGQPEEVSFAATENTDYAPVFTTATVNVLPFPPAVTVADAGGIYDGLAFPATGTVTGLNGVNLFTQTNPTFLYYLARTFDPKHPDANQPLGGVPSDAGNYIALCLYTGSGNYATGGATIPFTIAPAATSTTITSSVNPAVYGQPVTFTATVTNISGTTPAPVPVGAVQFVVDGVNSGSPVALIGGKAVSPIPFATGASHTVQAVYEPNLNSVGNPNFVNCNNSLTQGVQSFAIEPDPSNPQLSDLFVGAAGATSSGQVQINPSGKSTTGSSGVTVQLSFNGVIIPMTYSQSFNALYIYLQDGNDSLTMASTLTVNTVVSAGIGNDNILLSNGNNVVVAGTGNDSIQAGNGNNTVTLGNGNDFVTLGNGNNTVTLGDGNENLTAGNGTNTVTLGKGNDTVTAGDGNDTVQLGGGNNTVTLGNGNDNVTAGDGSNVVVEGNGTDTVTAGNGNNLIVGGLGRHTITVGNGTNILIDGSATVYKPQDSLRRILNDWVANPTASNQSKIRSRFTVNYNTKYANTLSAGSGIDWFFYKSPTTSNKKKSDFLN
jgi:hypothetical protein